MTNEAYAALFFFGTLFMVGVVGAWFFGTIIKIFLRAAGYRKSGG